MMGMRNLLDAIPRRSLLISLILWLGIVVLYSRTSYKRLSREEAKLKKKYTKTLEHLKKSQREAQNLPLVRARLDSLLQVWKKVQTSLPNESNLDYWLKATALSGSRAGIDFERFEPQPMVPHDLYEEYPIKMEVSGGFHEVATFLSFLLNMPRLSHIKDLKLEAIKKPNFPTETVKATFTLSTYAYNPKSKALEKKRHRKRKTRRT
jgi:type IV pilus assembly protein PilO